MSRVGMESWVESARHHPISTREWEQYPGIFQLPKDPMFWNGKKILDIGSGFKFTDPEETFPKATIFAIDPEFGPGGRIASHTAHEIRQAIAQDIPCETNTFDFVLSSRAVPMDISITEIPKVLAETIRVAKPVGEIRLTPCAKRMHISGELIEILDNAGFEIEFLEGVVGTLMILRTKEIIRQCLDLNEQQYLKDKAFEDYKQSILKPENTVNRFLYKLWANYPTTKLA